MTVVGRPNCATCGGEVPRFRWSNADVRAEAAYRREHPNEPKRPLFDSPICARLFFNLDLKKTEEARRARAS